MKNAFLSALIFTQAAVFAVDAHAATNRATTNRAQNRQRSGEIVTVREAVAYRLAASANTVTCCEAMELPPIAARASRQRLARPVYPVSGPLPRMAYERQPALLISPLAPPEYGSGQVDFVEREPYRTENPNRIRFQPNGVNLLSVRELW